MANVVTTDPIADMLTRIRNAIRARHDSVLVPHSNIKAEIAKVLKQEGYIEDVKNSTNDGKKMLKITFKMENGEQSVYITGNTKSEIELRVLGESCEFEIKVYISNLDN